MPEQRTAPEGAARLLTDLRNHLLGGCALALLWRRGLAGLRPGLGAMAMLVLAGLAVDLGFDLLDGLRTATLAAGVLVPGALPERLMPWVGVAVGAGAALNLLQPRPAPPLMPAATAALAIAVPYSVLGQALPLAAEGLQWPRAADPAVFWGPIVLQTVATLYAVATLAGGPRPGAAGDRAVAGPGARRTPPAARGLAAALVVAAAVALPIRFIDPAARLWSPAPAAEGLYDAVRREETFYAQADLLGEALGAIEPGESGRTELYFVGFAGHGPQDVFINEAEGAQARVAERFDIRGHSIVLANSHHRPAARPYASITALARTLAVVGEQMDPDEDILFLLLSSHGDEDGTFDVSMWPYQFDPLTPAALRQLLDDAGIRYRVVVVSACYSGRFVEALADPDTLVITASRADRQSFGCETGRAWTWFGQAFFDEALGVHDDLEAAFAEAARRIAERERLEGHPPSSPQISMGAGLRARLRELQRMPARVAALPAPPTR